MSLWKDLKGTVLNKFGIGLTGPLLKNNSNVLEVRNAADAAYASIKAQLFATHGNDFELNADAAGTSADWKMTYRRPSTGMTHALIFVMPSADPTSGQVLQAVSLVGDVITLGWVSAASTAACESVDTTALAWNSSSTVAMFTNPANGVVELVRVYVDTAFDGTGPSMSVGISGNASKYMGATSVDLTQTGTYEVTPGIAPTGSTEALQIAFSPASGGSTGAARVETVYAVPT